MSKREVKLIEKWIKNPETEAYNDLKKAVTNNPFKTENYENMGSVEVHKSAESVIEKMIQKQEAASGKSINQPDTRKQVNLNGIQDDRTEDAENPHARKGKKFKVGVK